jgi:gliding motility-associated-like protein
LKLNAQAGFKNYLWQDGSKDSVFTAVNTGLYYVTVTDFCGNLFSDSVKISPDAELVLFDIGPNTFVCKNDTLLLQVNATLNNYIWSPLVNTISQGPAAIKVFPHSSTWYHVSALKKNGCNIKDSILVDIHIPATINLGPDKNICAGDTTQLNAGLGFNNYTWSTNEHTASIKVFQTGQYYVAASDNNNCISRDSLSILKLIPLPVTQLPFETAICQGQPKIIHTGTGFKSYLWNTGTQTENIRVASLGQYCVTVTNSFDCKKTDTVRINGELPLPSGFIKYKDTTICNYETITVTPSHSFRSYLWSNGSIASSITLNNAGKYLLKVTDINGCVGSDNFHLSTKDCKIGVFFPTGFTPNDDRLNDTWKPRAYGRLNYYHIRIYNRYGEKIFESSNISEGWTCVFKGVKQGIGAFVWQCSYQLVGQSMQNSSGSFILIR